MTSSTSLLVTEETEPELPPLVERLEDLGLDEHGPQSYLGPQEAPIAAVHQHHQAAQFSLLGTVLDLQPQSRHQQQDEEVELEVEELDETESNTLLTQAQIPCLGSVMLPGLEAPETIMLYTGGVEDLQQQQVPGMIMILPPGYGEHGFEGDHPSVMRRKSVNTTECVEVPTSEHVAEIVGRQGESCSRV